MDKRSKKPQPAPEKATRERFFHERRKELEDLGLLDKSRFPNIKPGVKLSCE